MNTETQLQERSQNQCELCCAAEHLAPYVVAPSEESIYLCAECRSQLENPSTLNAAHWHCLNDSMWSTVPAVQVMAYRILTVLNDQDRLDMLYLEEDLLSWAKAQPLSAPAAIGAEAACVRDSNGTILSEGDSVTLIKDLDVKGAGFTAKRGTIVKNIRLTNDPRHIEGKINGSTIVLVAAYMKKV
ncbi:MAG: PhnA domain-containing protein [Sulfuricurvum sp.]|nr:PhnA domain-containing protein [Sulfuricurvum sp.]MDD2949185.1 PhnA domain-containing protein [Sulfuricurvum sp.]